MVDFDRPGFLLLIPAAILVQWLGTRNSLTRWPSRQKAWCGLLRAIIFSLVALALAGPRWLTKTTDPAVVLLRDVSASIGRDRQTQNAETAATFAGSHPERVAEVAFAREPQVIRGFGESSARDAAPEDKMTRKPTCRRPSSLRQLSCPPTARPVSCFLAMEFPPLAETPWKPPRSCIMSKLIRCRSQRSLKRTLR